MKLKKELKKNTKFHQVILKSHPVNLKRVIYQVNLKKKLI